MKQFKGTQGKWSVSNMVQQNEHGANYVDIDCIENGSGVSGLAVVYEGITEHGLEEMHSNAQLISKAPELLDFINRISGEMLRNDFVLSEKWYDQARQLIDETVKEETNNEKRSV